jgi:lysozyme
MKTSHAGRQLLQALEGVKLKAYQDEGGVWTIGTGHTRGVKEGDTCTWMEADTFLADDLAEAESSVTANAKVNLTQNQFDALVILTFNIGGPEFSKSHVVTFLNRGWYDAAAIAFLLFNKVKGKISLGLVTRRETESKFFLATTAAV